MKRKRTNEREKKSDKIEKERQGDRRQKKKEK